MRLAMIKKQRDSGAASVKSTHESVGPPQPSGTKRKSSGEFSGKKRDQEEVKNSGNA